MAKGRYWGGFVWHKKSQRKKERKKGRKEGRKEGNAKAAVN
jgi:hypothetical protein